MRIIFVVVCITVIFRASFAQFNVSGPTVSSEDTTFSSCFLDEFETNMRAMYQQYGSINEYEKVMKQLGYEPNHIPTFTHREYCQRLMKMNEYSLIPFDCHASVIQAIEDYAGRRRSTVRIALGRSKLYFDLYEAMLDKYDLPTELKYLSVIESMLIPKAKSRAGALGLWQFMYGTGKMFGLTENSFIDERMDPIKATDAACRYLKKLHDIYNDWNLALAAYNAGPGNVNKAIRRADGKTTYWEVRPFLPRETQDYVPRFMAFAYLMEHHHLHNIVPADVPITYYDVDTVCLRKGVQMQRIEALVGVGVDEIQYLNPIYKTTYIPKTNPPQCITLPIEKISLFIEYEEDIYKSNEPFLNQNGLITDSAALVSSGEIEYENKIRYHKVKKGESLSIIAKKYGTTKKAILKINNRTSERLRSGETIKIDYITVPIQKTNLQIDSSSISVSDSVSVSSTTKDSTQILIKPTRYQVKSRETLYSIAQIHMVTVDDIIKWNNLSSAKVYVGQVLLIYSEGINAQVAAELSQKNKPVADQAQKKFHTIKSGDNFGVLAKKYGTTVAAIQKLNPRVNPSRLQIGQKIRVK
jgi:membrane-bound lytic murein transglycosylase D